MPAIGETHFRLSARSRTGAGGRRSVDRIRIRRWGAEPAVSSSASWPVAPLSRSRLTPWLPSRAPAGLGGRGMLRMTIFLVTNNTADTARRPVSSRSDVDRHRNRAPPDPPPKRWPGAAAEPHLDDTGARQAPSKRGRPHHRPATAYATRTPRSATPATGGRPPAPTHPGRTNRQPVVVPPHASPAPARTTHLHRDTSSHRSTPAQDHHKDHRTNLAIQDLYLRTPYRRASH